MARSLVGEIIERRAVARIRNQQPVPYTGQHTGNTLGGIFRGGLAGSQEANMSAMGAVGTIFAIVNLTSTAVAALEWKLWRKSASGDPEDRTEVTTHAALDTLRKPNPFYTGEELGETVQQHIDLTGEGWIVIERAQGGGPLINGIPIALWPVRPDRISPVPSRDSFIQGYVYQGPDGEKIPLDVNQVLSIRMPNPLDPFRGMGPVQAILADAESIKYSVEWNRNFFINGAEPGGIIELDRRLSDTEWDDMRRRWAEGHRGTSNAHRVAILEAGKWVDRKFSHNDMQFAQLREVSDKAIRTAFAIHAHMLGDADDVNLANATAAEVTFARRLVVPRARRWKAMLNFEYLPLFGTTTSGLEFDFENPVAEDEKSDAETFLSRARGVNFLVNVGFDGPAAAEAAGLPPDMPFERREVTQSITEAQFAPTAPGEDGGDGADGAAPSGGAAAPPAAPKAPAKARMVSRETHPWWPATLRDAKAPKGGVDLTGHQESWVHALDQLVAAYGIVRDDQRAQLVNQVQKLIKSGDIPGLANMKVDTAEAKALINTAMQGLADVAGRQVVQEAARQGVEIEHHAAEASRLEDLAELTAQLLAFGLRISAAREASRAAGPDADAAEVAHQVDVALAALSDASLRTQLGGALTTAQNAGRISTMAAGPEAAMYASEVNDTNTCPPCNAVDGRWLGNTTDMDQVNSVYPSSGYIDCEGGERCRGTVVAVWRPDQQGDGEGE